MRSKRVENAIKTTEAAYLQVVGTDFSGQPIENFTNAGATKFCPFIDNEKLAQIILKARGDNVMHREYPVSFAGDEDYEKNGANKQNTHYHWVQIGFNNVQCCKYQRDPIDRNTDLCEKRFASCPVYREHCREAKLDIT